MEKMHALGSELLKNNSFLRMGREVRYCNTVVLLENVGTCQAEFH